MLHPTEKEFREKLGKFVEYLLLNHCEMKKTESNFEIVRFHVNGQDECIIGKKQFVDFTKVALELWMGFLTNRNIKFKKPKELFQSDVRNSIFNLLSQRDGNGCVYCGEEHTAETFTIEHFVPTSKGGANTLSNMLISCSRCNGNADTKTIMEKIAMIKSRL